MALVCYSLTGFWVTLVAVNNRPGDLPEDKFLTFTRRASSPGFFVLRADVTLYSIRLLVITAGEQSGSSGPGDGVFGPAAPRFRRVAGTGFIP